MIPAERIPREQVTGRGGPTASLDRGSRDTMIFTSFFRELCQQIKNGPSPQWIEGPPGKMMIIVSPKRKWIENEIQRSISSRAALSFDQNEHGRNKGAPPRSVFLDHIQNHKEHKSNRLLNKKTMRTQSRTNYAVDQFKTIRDQRSVSIFERSRDPV